MSMRIATFNLENLDDKPGQNPSLRERIAVMRPQLQRLRADILCFQEVNGQETPGQPRRLLALEEVLAGTPYRDFHMVSTMTADGFQVYDERNLVVASRHPITAHRTLKHDFAQAPQYRKVTASPPEDEARDVSWERPILHATIELPGGRPLHVINLHLKSRLPSNVDGQKADRFTWRTAAGWAEGAFLSVIKRVGQALETRILIDQIFDTDENAWIVVCGDLNADLDHVPVEAIRGDVENTGNGDLATRVMVPCELSVPETSRYSLYHHGRGQMLDHLLASRGLLTFYRGTEIHNELLHDESVAFARDAKFPESDHAPVVAAFDLPAN